jgi:hypothetical protein
VIVSRFFPRHRSLLTLLIVLFRHKLGFITAKYIKVFNIFYLLKGEFMEKSNHHNAGSHNIKTSNTPLYWGVAILVAVIILLALLMKPAQASNETTQSLSSTLSK